MHGVDAHQLDFRDGFRPNFRLPSCINCTFYSLPLFLSIFPSYVHLVTVSFLSLSRFFLSLSYFEDLSV